SELSATVRPRAHIVRDRPASCCPTRPSETGCRVGARPSHLTRITPLETPTRPDGDRQMVRRDVRRLYVAGSRLEMLEVAYQLSRGDLVYLLRFPGRVSSTTEQRQIDAYLARDGYLN